MHSKTNCCHGKSFIISFLYSFSRQIVTYSRKFYFVKIYLFSGETIAFDILNFPDLTANRTFILKLPSSNLNIRTYTFPYLGCLSDEMFKLTYLETKVGQEIKYYLHFHSSLLIYDMYEGNKDIT